MPGQRVFGTTWRDTLPRASGTFAEYAVAPASQLIAMPEGLGFEEAAAPVMSGLVEFAKCPADQAAEAVARMLSHRARGQVVIRVDGRPTQG